ncbi:endoglucanase H [Fodinibius salicampi]
MRCNFGFCFVLVILFSLTSCMNNRNTIDSTENDYSPPENPAEAFNPFELNQKLGKGINLGNALEAPSEGEWGMVIEEEYIELIRKAGFDAVRIPIRWNAHAQSTEPYTIDPDFFERVDEVVNWAMDRDLLVMINIHHYNALMEQPEEHRERFISLWKQIGDHYKKFPNTLLFEVLNEPHDNLGPDRWNVYLQDALEAIRLTNPNRTIVIGTAPWGGTGGLEDLSLPAEDQNIIVTVHNYNPFQFTHQGAEWVGEGEEADEWIGTTWTGTEEQKAELDKEFDRVEKWAEEHDRPIHMGEFGAYSEAPKESREIWTAYMRRSAEKRGFSWVYWEFGAGFGIYDRDNNQWREGLLEALIPNSPELQ